MRNVIVLLITLGILAVQFGLGLKRRKVLGAVLPVAFAALFAAMSWMGHTTDHVATGVLCVLGVWAAWWAGYGKARKHERAQLDRMKAKDIS